MKSTLTLLLALTTTLGFSQAGAKWATGGNAAATGDFLGTTNNFPIDFRTNNISRMNLSALGVLKITNLAGIGSRILQVDANGNIISLPAGAANQVLYGNGTWGALPTVPSTVWQTNSFGTYYFGNVGINKSNPQFALDVLGDAKISNNLIVGGGLIISQKVEATNSLKTDTVHSMTGETKFTSKVILKQQFQVDGTSLFNGTVQAGNLYVSGATNFANGANVNGLLSASSLNVANTFMANTLRVGNATNNADISLQIGANNARTIGFGYTNPIPGGPANSCVAPYTGPLSASFNGRSVITTQNVGNTTDPVFDFRNSGANGTIDYGFDYVQNPQPAQRTGPSTIPSIKINGSCWGDVELAKGGGWVSTGNYFEVGSPVSSYLITSNILGHNQIGQRVTLNSSFPTTLPNPPVAYNTQLFVNRNFIHALSVFNTGTNTNGDEVFTVFGDGKTSIGDNYVPNGYQLAVKGKIISEEMVVQLRANWPDYVFAKNYHLKPLSEIEAYINEHKHLQNIPSANEIEKEGVSLGSLVAKQMEKIEELTLYIIEQQKQLEELKKQMNSIKK